MKTTQRPDGWWITDLPDDELDVGPYDTKREVEDDRRGLERFAKYADRPGFMSVETA